MRVRRLVLIVIAGTLVASACSDDAATTTSSAPPTPTTTTAATTAATTTVATTQAPATTAAPATTVAVGGGLQIIQVGFDTSFQDGWVLLQNTGGEAVSLAGHYLCQRPSYFALPDITLDPGDVFWVGTVGPVDAEPTVGANGAAGTNSQSGGEMGLYSSNAFGDANAILSYVEWGNSGHGRSSVAVAAGIWGDGEFVTVPGELTGAISVDDPTAAPGAANWIDVEAP